MTCAITCKTENGEFITGIDTALTSGDLSTYNGNDIKYHVFGNSTQNEGVLVFSGRLSTFQKIIRTFKDEEYPIQKGENVTEKQIYKFINLIEERVTVEDLNDGFELLVVYKKDCYYVDEGLAIVKIKNYCCIGSGTFPAYGAMGMADNKNKKKDTIKKRILKSLRVVSNIMPLIRPPYVILEFETKTNINKFNNTYNETEEKKINKLFASVYYK